MSKEKILLFETFQTLAGLGFSVNIMRQTAGELPANPDALPDGRIPAAYVIADDEVYIWNESGSEWVKTDLIQARSFANIQGDPSDNAALQSVLDGKADYEVGTFESQITPQSGSITLTASRNTLAYSKKGDEYSVYGLLEVDTVSSNSGYFDISLPSTIRSGVEYLTVASLQIRNVVSANMIDFVGFGIQNNNKVRVQTGNGTSISNNSAEELQVGTQIYIHINYIS